MDYSLKNEVWLGGRPSHRLYDVTIFGGKRVLIEKNIVTNLDGKLENGINSTHSYHDDKLDDRSVISEGETVTYRPGSGTGGYLGRNCIWKFPAGLPSREP